MNKIIFLFFFLLLSLEVSSQTLEDREYIISQTNVEQLKQITEEYWESQNPFKDKKISKTFIDSNGVEHYFSHYNEDGQPIYCTMENESSARSSNVNTIRTGGSSGLDLDGSDMIIGLWDSGTPRVTHQELAGKIILGETGSATKHATHVAGIMVATGIDAEAKGMAPSAEIVSFNTQDKIAEIADWAANGGVITSHSYITNNPKEDYEKYGIYNAISKSWDNLSFQAPYLIMCTGASNNGNNNYNPDNSRYDLLASNKLGKNSIVVGACTDVLSYEGPTSVTQANFTSWGPTDDWRIKPDLTAVGTSSYSTEDINDSHYGIGQGCSYSSPVVAGGLALLQQHYHNNNAVYMRATTAKALILSTTDEAGPYDGPDFSNGWGLFNALKAAMVISRNSISSEILEPTINQEESYSRTIAVDGTKPLSVTICWNDPASEPLLGEFYNNPTPMLINDLDVRVVSDSTEYFPWRMEPNTAFDNYTDGATKGDNYRDNIEIINVENIAAGEYEVIVSHKGFLRSGSQDFSLIIDGLQDAFLSTSSSNPEQGMTINPNPVAEILNVDFGNHQMESLQVSIYNSNGLLQSESVLDAQAGQIQIDVSNYPKGSYFLLVQDRVSKKTYSDKFVKL